MNQREIEIVRDYGATMILQNMTLKAEEIEAKHGFNPRHFPELFYVGPKNGFVTVTENLVKFYEGYCDGCALQWRARCETFTYDA